MIPRIWKSAPLQRRSSNDFFESTLGRRFFEGQLPKLISALESISASLRAPRPVLQLPKDLSPEFLRELYHGNFDAGLIADRETLDYYNSEVVKAQKEAKEIVTPEVWKIIEHSYTVIGASNTVTNEYAFSCGFQTAFKMMAAGLSEPAQNKQEVK